MAEPKNQVLLTAGTGDAPLVVSTTGVKAAFPIVEPLVVTEVGVLLVAASSGSLVVDVDKRITPGSASGLVDKACGTLTGTVTGGLAAGKALRRFCNYKCDKGDELIFDVTTGLTGGTGIAYVKGYLSGQSGAESDDVASTT